MIRYSFVSYFQNKKKKTKKEEKETKKKKNVCEIIFFKYTWPEKPKKEIFEVAKNCNGKLVIPVRFFIC